MKSKLHITKVKAGGKAGSSTADHLIVLKQAIKEIYKDGKTANIIFLDVQKAYDKAWLDAIIYTLYKKRNQMEKPSDDQETRLKLNNKNTK